MYDILLTEFNRNVEDILIDYNPDKTDISMDFKLLKEIIDKGSELFNNPIYIKLKIGEGDSQIISNAYDHDCYPLNSKLYMLLSTMVIKLDDQFNNIKLDCTMSELMSYRLRDIYDGFIDNISQEYGFNFTFGYSTIVGQVVQKLLYKNFKIFISQHFFTELKTVDKIIMECNL